MCRPAGSRPYVAASDEHPAAVAAALNRAANQVAIEVADWIGR